MQLGKRWERAHSAIRSRRVGYGRAGGREDEEMDRLRDWGPVITLGSAIAAASIWMATGLAKVNAGLSEVRIEIQTVRTEVQMVRTEVETVRTELRTEIQKVRTEIQEAIAPLNARMSAMEAKMDILIGGLDIQITRRDGGAGGDGGADSDATGGGTRQWND